MTDWSRVNFAAYAAARYTPPPELLALPDADFILSGWGGIPDPMIEERDRQYATLGKKRRP